MSKIRNLFVVLALVVGITVAVQSPAMAAWTGCSASPQRVCTYWDANGNGAVYYYTSPFNTCINIGEPWEDDISSVWNRFTGWVIHFYLYSDSCSGGGYIVVEGGLGTAGQANYGGTFLNDSFSSLKIVSA